MNLPTVWTSRDGRETQITQMDDKHLYNTLNYLERTAQDRLLNTMRNLAQYSYTAPDGAADCADMACDELMETEPQEFLDQDESYQALLMEAARRWRLQLKS